VHDAIAMGIRDYFSKMGFSKAILEAAVESTALSRLQLPVKRWEQQM
jgi:hypothetical protein